MTVITTCRQYFERTGHPTMSPREKELLRQGHICSEKLLHEHESKVRAVARHLVEHHYMDRVVFEAMMKES
jgi:hypothetical protein